MNKKSKTKRLTLIGVLTAIALTIFVLEAQIPPLTAIPGIKLGLANIVTLFALAALSPKDALIILVLRVLLGGVFAGQPMTILYSMTGGLLCLLCETFLLKLVPEKQIWAVGAAGAMVHNFGQIAVAALITMTPQVFWYLPYLIIAGLITGTFTGAAVGFSLKAGRDIIKKL